ncbi:MAG: hypothetical protein LKI98_05495 [Bifidobacterium crudilactis]|jgi:putative component of membrane protein insertase Oxa1/YidC/SpoIIIJ protein YidD|nr:hypothetical protein [Bifidobacterium crudilactis]MCI1889876.1 hypothetical protein [Bifidobacterium crudilactis]
MAALVCQDCRFTPICLATSICNADQHGIVAGLPVRARRRVRRMAEAAGIEIVRGEQASVQRLSRWIYANPEVIATARAEENKRLRRELNTSNQRRLRDNKRTGDAVPVVSSPPESDGSGNQGRLFE